MYLNDYYLSRYSVDDTRPSVPEQYKVSPVDQSVINQVVFIDPITHTLDDSLTHMLLHPELQDSLANTLTDTSQPSEHGSDEDKLATLKPRNCQSAAEQKLYLDSLKRYSDAFSQADQASQEKQSPSQTLPGDSNSSGEGNLSE